MYARGVRLQGCSNWQKSVTDSVESIVWFDLIWIPTHEGRLIDLWASTRYHWLIIYVQAQDNLERPEDTQTGTAGESGNHWQMPNRPVGGLAFWPHLQRNRPESRNRGSAQSPEWSRVSNSWTDVDHSFSSVRLTFPSRRSVSQTRDSRRSGPVVDACNEAADGGP
jgi:hypothetical protein